MRQCEMKSCSLKIPSDECGLLSTFPASGQRPGAGTTGPRRLDAQCSKTQASAVGMQLDCRAISAARQHEIFLARDIGPRVAEEIAKHERGGKRGAHRRRSVGDGSQASAAVRASTAVGWRRAAASIFHRHCPGPSIAAAGCVGRKRPGRVARACSRTSLLNGCNERDHPIPPRAGTRALAFRRVFAWFERWTPQPWPVTRALSEFIEEGRLFASILLFFSE